MRLASHTARERELFRYYQPVSVPHAIENIPARVTQSSLDACLTAFAQLGSLRLNVKRGLISLSTQDTEYILAEAGPTLSLQQDNDKDDALWYGVGTFKGEEGIGTTILDIFCNPDSAPSYLVINDLTKDDRFKDKAVVKRGPLARFMACVPIRSTYNSLIIGAYIVVDDNPRDGLTESEIEFIKDMATTVMAHLETKRIRQKEQRAEQMVKALGLFVEGKQSLRDWWLKTGHSSKQNKVNQALRDGFTLDSQADIKFGIQNPASEPSIDNIQGLQNCGPQNRPRQTSLSSVTTQTADGENIRPSMRHQEISYTASNDSSIQLLSDNQDEKFTNMTSYSTAITSTGSMISSSITAADSIADSPLVDAKFGKQLQEALLSVDLKKTFSRAASLICDATEVEGCIFFDASVGSFGASTSKDSLNEKAPGGFTTANGLSETAETTTSNEDDPRTKAGGSNMDQQEQFCEILGFSTRTRSSLRFHDTSAEQRSLPESFLRRLSKKYPHGKIFNFTEDGSISSSDADEHALRKKTTFYPKDLTSSSHDRKTRKYKRQISKEAEAAAILAVIPGARSAAWFPLWDGSKERWFAGSLTWSILPTRVLCPVEDLTYMAAFGNSIMAEVSRLSALVTAQLKSDFISSISHELRSPLHGVLASVEFLQETKMTEMQGEIIDTINSCGKTLLDTINHILDFSKITQNLKEKGKPSKEQTRRRSKNSSLKRKTENAAKPEDVPDISVLTEEVIDSVYIGQGIGQRLDRRSNYGVESLAKGPAGSIAPIKPAVAVIVDIGWRNNWKFEINSGAWRRILMNIFSNAMKYTDEGFVKVSVSVEDLGLRDSSPQSVLTLTVADSGKGISAEFLQNKLYTPFAQEDEFASGSGLGLSMVRMIVNEMRGTIEFKSEPGTGTEAIIRLPLATTSPRNDINSSTIISAIRRKALGLKVCLVAFDRFPDLGDVPTGILSPEAEALLMLRKSVVSMMTHWFCMEVVMASALDFDLANVHLILQSGNGEIDTDQDFIRASSTRHSKSLRESIVIYLSKSYDRSKSFVTDEGLQVFYLQQPYSPHRLAKVFYQAICRPLPNRTNLQPRSENSKVPPPMHIQQGETQSLPAEWNDATIGKGDHTINLEPKRFSGTSQDLPAMFSEERLRPIFGPLNKKVKEFHVLLVEDNKINLKLLIMYMQKLEVRYSTATNGLEALKAYKGVRGRFDVIFMDISMPVMDGLQSSREIRKFERENGHEAASIVALTGAASAQARHEAFGSGINLFLTKPVPLKDLKKIMDDLKHKRPKSLMITDDSARASSDLPILPR